MKIINVKLINGNTIVKDVQSDLAHEIIIEYDGITTCYHRLQKCANGQSAWRIKTDSKSKKILSSKLELCYQRWLVDQIIYSNYETVITPYLKDADNV